MGSTKLKKKEVLRYRKGSTSENLNCRYCVNYLADQEITGIGGVHLRTEDRCKIMGLGTSIKYRVQPDHRCDAQKLDVKKCWWLEGETNDEEN